MILVENIYVNKDGSRLHHRQDCTPLLLSDGDDSTMSPLSSKGASGNREADLKNMFVSDTYVDCLIAASPPPL